MSGVAAEDAELVGVLRWVVSGAVTYAGVRRRGRCDLQERAEGQGQELGAGEVAVLDCILGWDRLSDLARHS